MIARVLMAFGLLGSLGLPLGLAAYLSWDQHRGEEIWVPVAPPLVDRTELSLMLAPLSAASDRDPWLVIQLDERRTAIDAIRAEIPASPRPGYAVALAPKGLPTAHRRLDGSEPAYAIYRISPSGVAYLVGLADADRAPVRRGD